MNSQIDDLYRQARLDAGYEKDFEATVQDVYQRFAELIVQECMKVSNRSLSKYELPSDKIAEHFGVEE